MKLEFAELFSIRLKHDYYKSGLCADFSVKPSESSKKVMDHYKLRFVPTTTGGNVYYQKVSGNPAVAFDNDFLLSFDLILNNVALFNFTDLADYEQGSIYSFTNFNQPGLTLRKEVLPKQKKVFQYVYDFVTPQEDVQLILKNIRNKNIWKKNLNEIDKVNELLDFSMVQDGIYRLVLKQGAGTVKNDKIYLGTGLEKMFGRIDFYNNSGTHSFNTEQGKSYTHKFENKETQWIYKVINKNAHPNLNIHDLFHLGVTFHRSFTDEPELLIFKSVDNMGDPMLLPLKEEPAMDIQLLNNADVLIENLPSPGMNNQHSEMIIYV